jgi:hypothetical protein
VICACLTDNGRAKLPLLVGRNQPGPAAGARHPSGTSIRRAACRHPPASMPDAVPLATPSTQPPPPPPRPLHPAHATASPASPATPGTQPPPVPPRPLHAAHGHRLPASPVTPGTPPRLTRYTRHASPPHPLHPLHPAHSHRLSRPDRYTRHTGTASPADRGLPQRTSGAGTHRCGRGHYGPSVPRVAASTARVPRLYWAACPAAGGQRLPPSR